MPIDTRVPGDPEALRAAARWLRDGLGSAVRAAADGVHRSCTDTERAWAGAAGDAFRVRMLSGALKSDELAVDVAAAGRTLDVYADDLTSAKAGMARARQIALDAGLSVESDVIADPGPHGVQVAAYDAAREEVERVRRTQAAQFRQDYLRAPGGSPQAQAITRAEQAAANAADDAAARAGGFVRSVASKAPVIGIGITAAGIGWDIQHGKPPGKAIVAGVAGGAAAFAAGALLAGPPGWVAAGAILTGIGVGMAADYAYDNWLPDDVKAGIDNGAHAVGDAIGDTWDTVFG